MSEEAALIRRLLTTGACCGAPLMLRNSRTGEWYAWDTCTEEVGHQGDHAVIAHDGICWAQWNGVEGEVTTFLADEADPFRCPGSPWTETEAHTLARFRPGSLVEPTQP